MGETEEEKRRFDRLCDNVDKLVENMDSLNTIGRGKKNSPEPEGLIHECFTNTRFRHNVTKILWIEFGLISGIIFNELMKMFQQ